MDRVWWGGHGFRLGWWITLSDGKIGMVRGPSICVSSGGGPPAARAEAERMGYRDIEVVPPPPHDDVDDKPCMACFQSDAGAVKAPETSP
jgi:hypothetical protein